MMFLLRLQFPIQICFLLLLILSLYKCQEDEKCNRTPLQSKTQPLPPDDRFAIDIVGLESTYIPGREYTVRLKAMDEPKSHFIAFTIYAEGDEKENDKIAHKKIPLQPGIISSSKDDLDQDTITSTTCKNTVTQQTLSPKTEVEVLWIAPPKGNRCVKIYAFVAVKRDVWYNSEGPLSKIVCEDLRKNEDMKPAENNHCQVCEDARYELMFEGLWSKNTHSDMFPITPNVAKFGDIVGASHNKDFILYKDDGHASPGLKTLVEQGNTSAIEEEIIRSGIGTKVRTLLKATGPPKPSMSTLASFRTSQEHHYVSLVTAILPSPDWFLGAYDIELCEAGKNPTDLSRWTKKVVLNLYPMDAGVDSGITFESSNDPTNPQATIAKARIVQDKDPDDYRPFARIHITLITTYPKSICQAKIDGPSEDGGAVTDTDTSEDNFVPEMSEEPITRSTTSSPSPAAGQDVDDKCQVTDWEEWQPCEGECVDNELVGYKSRFRSYIVDGVAVDGYEGNKNSRNIPAECFERYSLIDIEECREPCEPDTEEPESTAGEQESVVST